jgi:two-component system sensor histidine kinase/response regulator
VSTLPASSYVHYDVILIYEYIGMAVELMLQLADDVLNLEQLEQGRLQLHYECVNLWHLISVVAKQHEFQFKKKHLSFHVHIAPSFPVTAIIDRTRIIRILSHFLSNAAKVCHVYHSMSTSIGYIRCECHIIHVLAAS